MGFTGLKDLGVKEMNYKLAFLACSVKPAEEADGEFNIRAASAEGVDGADIISSFTEEEREEIASIKEMPNLFSMFISVIKLSNIFLSIKTLPPYFITMRSFLYFSMYFETSSIGGPSLGSIFSKSINQ